MKPLFSRKIICSECGKFHKTKLARKKRIYCCSTFDNKGKEYCNRNKIDEGVILDYLGWRYKDLPLEEQLSKVKLISINQIELRIELLDGEDIIIRDNFIQF